MLIKQKNIERYTIAFGAESGGYKKIWNPSNPPIPSYYSGQSFSKEVLVVFDVEKPFHCLKYDNCPPDYEDTPVAFGLSQDLSKVRQMYLQLSNILMSKDIGEDTLLDRYIA